MASATWRGSLSFGLLTIPIRMYPAARRQRTYLHQLHSKCHTRLKQPLFCPTCNRIVNRDEVVKGYEFEEGQYVLVDKEDLKKITPKSGKIMEILLEREAILSGHKRRTGRATRKMKGSVVSG